ncbi:MAG: hypothetical protein FVQ84_17780 [Planctomycetes bacterium]|nr:hypothetical protein [Planctomycetota bacterium]
MVYTTTNTENHISPKNRAILDDFMVETSSFEASESTSSMPSASPEALLSVLKDAKALVNSLQSRQEPNEHAKEIITRLANVEAELTDLKSKITDLLNKA